MRSILSTCFTLCIASLCSNLVNAATPTDTAKKSSFAVQQTTGIAGMHLKLSDKNSIFDECGIYFDKDNSDNYDNDDAIDLDGIGPVVYLSSFTADNKRTSINVMGDYTHGKRVKLFVKGKTSGVYHLDLEDISNINTDLFNVYVVDELKHDSLDMVLYKSYLFDIDVTDTNSYGANRLVLAVEKKDLPAYQLISFNAEKAPAGVQLSWKAYNEGSFTGFEVQKQNSSNEFVSIDTLQSNSATDYAYLDKQTVKGSNVYRLKQSDFYGNITYTPAISINYADAPETNAITIFPNPSKDQITVNVNNAANTTYMANIYNYFGKLVSRRAVNSNTYKEDITAYKNGIYVIELKSADGKFVSKSKFVKTN